MTHPARYAIWSVDWEDNDGQDYAGTRFAQVCRPMQELLAELAGGKVTWFAKVDWTSDITDHDGLDRVAGAIVAGGGEIGLHTHLFSWEPYWRERGWRRGLRILRERWGVEATSYSSGMGNYIESDTAALASLGFAGGRLLYPGLKHDFKEWFAKPYAGLAGMDLLESPMGSRAGYVDAADCRRYAAAPTIINFPQARLPEYATNPDNQFQLTIGVNTEANTDRLIAHAASQSRFVHAYCHPYDMMDAEARLTPEAARRARHLAQRLRAEGYTFVTVAEAAKAFGEVGEL
ncbi:MAG: hypothetical protein NTW19_15075 [Planctomycetota bacterium]|nr:hypothetical protein [Planctomycetota bacterium]